jgi:hypothetical protein
VSESTSSKVCGSEFDKHQSCISIQNASEKANKAFSKSEAQDKKPKKVASRPKRSGKTLPQTNDKENSTTSISTSNKKRKTSVPKQIKIVRSKPTPKLTVSKIANNNKKPQATRKKRGGKVNKADSFDFDG